MAALSHKLTQRLAGIRAYPVGISEEDIQKLNLTSELVSDIFECLESSEVVDEQMALFFSDVLIGPGKLDEKQESQLLSRLIDLSCSKSQQVQAPCFKLLRRFHPKVPNYRSLMLKGLASSNSMVRKEALLAYETYRQPKETAPLERFENDTYVTELSMNGPLIYELRNLALESIEHVIGKNFKKTEKTEITAAGEAVFWWDWAPYLTWKSGWLNKFLSKR
jgi:hypothetical protein